MNNQAKIAELKKNINNKFFPEALKPKLLAQIEKLEEEDKASENKGILPHPKPKQSKTSVAKTDGMPKFVVGDIVKLKDTYDFTTPAIIKSFKNNQKDEFVYECMYIGPSQKKFTTNESDLELYNSKNLDYDKMSDADFAFTILGKIVAADGQAWNETKADSGSEIRNSEKLTKLYATSLEKSLKDLKVKKNSLTEKEYDYLVDNNYHLLNEFLFWNDFYENDLAKGQKEMYQRLFDDKNNQSSTANPDWITIGKTSTKILPKSIEILWAEGANSTYDKFPKKYNSFEAANKALLPVYKDGEKYDGGYNKTAFKIVWTDGEEYEGRLDIGKHDNPTETKNLIGEHAVEFLKFAIAEPVSYDTTPTAEYQRLLDSYMFSGAIADSGKGILPHPKPKKPTVARTVKSELKKYYAHREIKTVTVIEDGKKVVYKGEDVLNGAQFLAKGGKVEEIATYYPIRAIVEVTLDNGEKVKPANGYHIKNGAKPIAELGAALATEEIINNSIVDYQNPRFAYAKGGKLSEIIIINSDNEQNRNKIYNDLKDVFPDHSILKLGDNAVQFQGSANDLLLLGKISQKHNSKMIYAKGGTLDNDYVILHSLLYKDEKLTVDKNEKGKWTIYSEHPDWEKRDEFPDGFVSKDDALLVAKGMAGYTKEFANGGEVDKTDNSPKLVKIAKVIARKLFNEGYAIYIQDAPGTTLDMTNNIEMMSQTATSFNIYRGLKKSTYWDFDVIIDWVESKTDFPLKYYTFNSKDNTLAVWDYVMLKSGGWVKDHKYINKSEAYEVRYAKGKNRKGYMENGGLTSGSGDFDYIKFLDFVQPNVAATLLENNVTLLNDYTIVHEGKEFEPVIIYKGIDGKANALSVGYFADNDPQLKLLLSIDFELDEMEYHIRSKGWNINDVDMYAKGGWVKDHQYLNKAEDYETRYAKGKNRKGYMDKGGPIIGRKAKGVSVKTIAEMHNVTEKYLRKQLQRGQKVELEHTTDEAVAYAIAKDHIYENPDYYILLEKIEMKANGGEVSKEDGILPHPKPKREGSKIFAKAAEIREPGEKWQEAVRRANLLLKK